MNSFKSFFVVPTDLMPVFVLLCYSVVASGVGAYLQIQWDIGGTLTAIPTIGCMHWLMATPPHEKLRKVSLLIAFALLQGVAIGPLIKSAIDSNTSIMTSALMTSVLTLASVSTAAESVRRKAYLFSGGALSVAVLILSCFRFGSLILDLPASVFKYELYSGLLLFVGFMLVDTQEIVMKFEDLDHVKHGFLLFTDFMSVFVRVINLVMLLKS